MDKQVPHKKKKAQPADNACTIKNALLAAEKSYFFVGIPKLRGIEAAFSNREKSTEFFRVNVSDVSTACLEEFMESLRSNSQYLEHSRLDSFAPGAICVLAILNCSPPESSSLLPLSAFIVFCIMILFLAYFAAASSWQNRKASFLYLINFEIKRRSGGGGPFDAIINDS